MPWLLKIVMPFLSKNNQENPQHTLLVGKLILSCFPKQMQDAKFCSMFFVYQGFRTLEDIRTKAHLSNTQKIGLKYYEDFLDRMPRGEAAAIEKVVMHFHLSQLLYLLLCEACLHLLPLQYV